MNRYVKAVLGGFLAILAAFGWAVAIFTILAFKGGDTIVGIDVRKGSSTLLIILSLIFSVGFYLAFRAAYSKN
jgi:hypothetical protein